MHSEGMPYCACFHDYTCEPDGFGRPLDVEGQRSLLNKALGSRDGRVPLEMLALLKRRIVIDLTPSIDECYALGPYTLVGRDDLVYARYGSATNRAKYWNDQDAVVAISKELGEFAEHHPRLKAVGAVCAPPRSTSAAPNIPLKWAHDIAAVLGARVLEVDWVGQPTGNRKNNEANVSNAMTASGRVGGGVLVIDDTLGHGNTMKEMGRALRQAGAQRVYGLCVAKDMRGIARNPDGTYGIVLSEERWS